MRFRCAIAHTREESDCASERWVRRRSGAGAGERNPGETRFDTSNDPHGDRICSQDS